MTAPIPSEAAMFRASCIGRQHCGACLHCATLDTVRVCEPGCKAAPGVPVLRVVTPPRRRKPSRKVTR